MTEPQGEAARADAAVEGFIGRYTPDIAQRLQACRARLHALIPRGHELVFDNYNALVFGFAPTQRSTDAMLSIAGYPRWVTLFFLHGAALDDPEHLLTGDGTQVRGIRLASAADLDRPAVRRLIDLALQPQAAAYAQAPPLATTIKTVVAKQRSRRPASDPSPLNQSTSTRPTPKSTR